MKLFIPKQLVHGTLSELSGFYCFRNMEDLKEKPESVDEVFTSTMGNLVVGTEDFQDLCNVYRLNVKPFPSIRFQRSYQTLLEKNDSIGRNADDSFFVPSWDKCMPAHIFKKELAEFVRNLKEQISLIKDEGWYFKNVYKKHNIVFNSLQPAKVCPGTFLKAITSPSTVSKDILSTFAPQEAPAGYTKPVEYLRNDTATGRLKIRDGSPNILLLSRDMRNEILGESRFGKGNGGIYYLDFKSLEPRVLLSVLLETSYTRSSSLSSVVLKVPQDSYDIYQTVIDNLGIKHIPRSAVKLAILMVIYGAKEQAVIEKLREQEKIEDVSVAKKIYRFVHQDAFGIDLISSQQYLVPDNLNRIYNYYGRPMLVEGIDDYKLINYFIQSTAVDVALFGFANIINKIHETRTMNSIVPLFVLHDALFLDVHNDYVFALEKLANHAGKKGNIPKFEHCSFPIDISKI